MASTAAPSAPILSPRPIQRLAAMAAASVVRTRSMARFRSGAWRVTSPRAMTIVGRRSAAARRSGLACPAAILEVVDQIVVEPSGPLRGTVTRRRGEELGAQADGGLPARRGAHGAVQRPSHHRRRHHGRGAAAPWGARSSGSPTGSGGDDARRTATWCPAAPYELFERCGPRWWCSACCWLAAGRCGCRCPAVTTSATGRSTSTSTGSPPWAPASSPRTARCAARCPGGRLVGTPGRPRVPEPHRDRQPAYGGGAGQGHDGHRERGQGARGRRPGRPCCAPWGRWCAGPGRRGSRSRASRSCARRHTVVPDRVVAATFLARGRAWPAAT